MSSLRFENPPSTPVVCVIGDDPAARETLESLTARELLLGCVVLQVKSAHLRELLLEKLSAKWPQEALSSAIAHAVGHSRLAVDHETRLRVLRGRYAALSSREREVMELVVKGWKNKQIAFSLGISLVTTKVHRGRAMRKMGARGLADMINMTLALTTGTAA